jgi:hypothetical protein
MSTKQIEYSWRSEVLSADPEHPQKWAQGPEYKFSNGRVFTAKYAERGAYADE